MYRRGLLPEDELQAHLRAWNSVRGSALWLQAKLEVEDNLGRATDDQNRSPVHARLARRARLLNVPVPPFTSNAAPNSSPPTQPPTPPTPDAHSEAIA